MQTRHFGRDRSMNFGRILAIDELVLVRKLLRACFEGDGSCVDEATNMAAAHAALAI